VYYQIIELGADIETGHSKTDNSFTFLYFSQFKISLQRTKSTRAKLLLVSLENTKYYGLYCIDWETIYAFLKNGAAFMATHNFSHTAAPSRCPYNKYQEGDKAIED